MLNAWQTILCCPGDDCVLSDMRSEGFQFFNFTVGKGGGHIGGVADLFNFGSQYNESYVGETVVGVPRGT